MMLFSISIAILAFLVSEIEAGQGLGISACVWYRNGTGPNPSQGVPVAKFKRGKPSHCMWEVGHDGEVGVYGDGIHCADLGYIEKKSTSSHGDTCATDWAHYGISFQVGPSSGSTELKFASGEAYLEYDSRDTNICTLEDHCSARSRKFSGSPHLFIVFNPIAADGGFIASAEEVAQQRGLPNEDIGIVEQA